MIPLFWYRGFTNFGDRLSRFIVESLCGESVRYSEESPKLLGLGSILPFAKSGDVLWGTGAWHDRHILPKDLDVRAVRGPATRSLLKRQGITCPEIYGDPALLLPRYYKPNIRLTKGITALRHYRDDWFPHGADHVLSVTDDPFTVIDRIASAEIFVTSTLHGLIVAEAYGVPVVLLRNGRHAEIEPSFKYIDYFASTGREDLSRFDESLKEAVRHALPPPKLPDLDALVDAFPHDAFRRDEPRSATKNISGSSDIDNLADFIRWKTDNKAVKLFLRPGDAGDALVNVGFFHYCAKNEIDVEIVPFGAAVEGQTLFFSGGGNYVPYYTDCKDWLRRYHERNRCIVLPQTIDDDSVRNISYKTSLICRDDISYGFCRRFAPCDAYRHRDLAFEADLAKLGLRKMTGNGDVSIYRNDIEASGLFKSTPHPLFREPTWRVDEPNSMFASATRFLDLLNDYEHIETDRLHVAIGAALLGKKCRLYPNSYHKNKAVFDSSLKDKTSVEWAEPAIR